MKNYPADKIRNIALLGHGGAGKTAFAEAALFNAKTIDRLGKSADGNTVMDFDPEEIRRKISINTSVATLEWRDCKINLIDTPGDFDFLGEVMQGLRVADSSLILISAKDGFSVGAEKSVRLSKKRGLPVFFMINRMDEANASFDKAVESLQQHFGKGVVPFALPIVVDGKMTGVVDVISGKAYGFDAKGGSVKEIPVPASLQDTIGGIMDTINEAAAESDEQLMEKFFGGEPFTQEELIQGLCASIRAGTLNPVFVGSGTANWGMSFTMDRLVDYAPSPLDMPDVSAETPDGTADGPSSLKIPPHRCPRSSSRRSPTPFVGRISLFRVYSGTLQGQQHGIQPCQGKG